MQHLVRTVRRLFTAREGQGMTEYAIVLALVAIAAIGAVSYLGQNVRTIIAASSDALTGDTDSAADVKHGAAGKFAKEANFKDFSKKQSGF